MSMRILALVLSLTLALFGCDAPGALPPELADDEIALQIKLDTKEDIGLLVVNYDANGSGGSGGVSNADKSLLKRDDLITYTLDRRSFDGAADTILLSLQFSIITEYFDPNYENIYPAAYTKRIEALPLEASFGESYAITISGDKINGYAAVLSRSKSAGIPRRAG